MTRTVDQELVVLVTDQELTLADSLAGLRAWLDRGRSAPGKRWRVTLVDNGSTDATARIGQHFAASVDDVDFVGLPAHVGRSDLRARWANSSARTVAFLELSPGANFDVLLGPALEHAGCDGRTEAVDRFPLGGLVDRRTALGAIGGLGLAAFVTACTGSSSSTAKASTPPSTRLASSSSSSSSFSTTSSSAIRRGQSSSTTTATRRPVGLAPEIIEGPYYLDLNKVRSDITEDRKGVALALNLVVVDAATGGPIKGAAVDVWHADAEGLYSGFVKTSAGVNKQTAVSADDGTFLRGT